MEATCNATVENGGTCGGKCGGRLGNVGTLMLIWEIVAVGICLNVFCHLEIVDLGSCFDVGWAIQLFTIVKCWVL